MSTQTDDAAAPSARTPPVDPRLLRYARASRGFFVAIAFVAVAQTAVVVAFAWFLASAIVGVVEGAPWEQVGTSLALLAGAVVLRALLLWTRETIAARAAARVEIQLRDALLDAVDRLGPEWLSARSSATLAVTAGRGLDALDAYFGRYLPQLVQTVVATPVILAVLWWQDWISGLTVLVTLPLIPIFMVLIGLATRAVQRRQWRTLGHLAARFSDTVQGLSTLKVFGRQHRAADSIERVTDDYRRETMRVLRVSFLSGFALEFLASISVAVVAVSIGFRLLDGSLALVVGLFVLLLAPEAYLPLRQVGVQFHAAAEGVAATDDVFDVLDAARGATAGAHPATAAPPSPGGELVLSEVRVRRGDVVLPPIDLRAAAGELVLLEGPSGSGKSSLFAALRGAAAFDGTGEYAGIDIRSLDPASWLGWAGQEAGLVAGSVRDNVCLGDPDGPVDSIARRALVLAAAEGIDLDLGLGVQGAGLSGGQAQRVGVARAVYRHLRGHAPVLAFDEPSAALDATTEDTLWRSLRGLADAGAIVLLVSHRTSARAVADRVVRLSAAEVIA